MLKPVVIIDSNGFGYFAFKGSRELPWYYSGNGVWDLGCRSLGVNTGYWVSVTSLHQELEKRGYNVQYRGYERFCRFCSHPLRPFNDDYSQDGANGWVKNSPDQWVCQNRSCPNVFC